MADPLPHRFSGEVPEGAFGRDGGGDHREDEPRDHRAVRDRDRADGDGSGPHPPIVQCTPEGVDRRDRASVQEHYGTGDISAAA